MASLDEHWRELVTAALLGTERRSPPRPPVALVADVVDDGVAPDDAARMLATVVRRHRRPQGRVRAAPARRPVAAPAARRPRR